MSTIAERLDELPATRKHWKIVGLSGVGWAFDAMDVVCGDPDFIRAVGGPDLARRLNIDSNSS